MKCDKLILKYMLLCQEQISLIWLAVPPQEFGIVYLRIWHPAILSDKIGKKCPPDDITALSMEGSKLVPYLYIRSNNRTPFASCGRYSFIPILHWNCYRARDIVRVHYNKMHKHLKDPTWSQTLNFSGALKCNLYILGGASWAKWKLSCINPKVWVFRLLLICSYKLIGSLYVL